MRVMRQDLGDKMTRVEQRPPLQAVRNVDRILNPNLDNRGEGVCINDDQRTGDDTGQQHGPNPNQRARVQHDDYGEEDEDFLPRPRAPRWQNRNQGFEEEDFLPLHRAPRQQNYNQGPGHIKMTAPSYAGKSQVSWNSSNNNYNKSVDKGKGIEGDIRPEPRSTEPTKETRNEPAKTTNPQRARDITVFKCRGRGHMARECPNQRVMLLTDDGYESRDEEEIPEIQEE
ncbi:unnamed protein product [Brassica oleracea]